MSGVTNSTSPISDAAGQAGARASLRPNCASVQSVRPLARPGESTSPFGRSSTTRLTLACTRLLPTAAGTFSVAVASPGVSDGTCLGPTSSDGVNGTPAQSLGVKVSLPPVPAPSYARMSVRMVAGWQLVGTVMKGLVSRWPVVGPQSVSAMWVTVMSAGTPITVAVLGTSSRVIESSP
jgi:hypothetical protein